MELLFPIMALVAILSALGVVAFRNPVNSALCLILNMVTLAGLFASLDAHFLAVVQIIVYAGAVMVLVMFVLMLLNVKVEAATRNQVLLTLVALLAGAGFLTAIVPVMKEGFEQFAVGAPVEGSLLAIGKLLYTKYVLAFEASGMLLLGALVGAVMLAKTRRTGLTAVKIGGGQA